MKSIILLSIFSFCFSYSNLNDWIKEKTKIINSHEFILTFDYYLENESSSEPIITSFIYNSFSKDSAIIYDGNRIVIQHSNYTEIIDSSTKQIFLQNKENNEIIDKIFSIFKNKNYKIIQYSNGKYLLSLNDYFLNMDIRYNKKNDFISKMSFSEDLDSIHLRRINISISDSFFVDSTNYDSYEIFDLR
mgnify:FL=1|tara:strand:+ start:121 stop:687 length:567 start_codon:yes stop_codon:yes gene_type:complete